MNRLMLWLVLVGVCLLYQPVMAQDKQQAILTIPHEWSIGGARWQRNSRDFWTWNRHYVQTAGNPDYQDRLRLWDGSTGNLKSELLYHGDNVAMQLDWSAGEDRVLVYSGETLEIWDAVRGEKTFIFAYTARISGARWSADFSRLLFWSYDDGSLHIWDTTTGKPTFVAETHMASDLVQALWSPDEQTILAILTQSPGRVEVWDVASGQRTAVLEYRGMVYRADWNADGTRLLIEGDKIIQLVDAATQTVILGLSDVPYLYRSHWSPDRQRVAVRVENDSHVEVWDTQTGTVLATVIHPDNTDNHVFEVLWSADNRHLLTHSADEIVLWDVSNGAKIFQLSVEARRFSMSWLAWSPDEKQLVIMRSDSTLQIVALDTQASVELEMPAPVKLSFPNPTFAWNKDASRVMLWGIDNTARVWDTTSGNLLATLEHPVPTGFQAVSVTEALWSADEQFILTLGQPDYCGGLDTCPSEARIWRVPS